jgi:probable HAF family extracellular repeat protein
MKKPAQLSLSLLSLALASSTLAATQYTVTDLGTLGGTASRGVALNNNGHVVGYADTPTQARHPFFYDGKTLQDLTLIMPKSLKAFYGGNVWAINDKDQIALSFSVPDDYYDITVIYNAATRKATNLKPKHVASIVDINHKGRYIGVIDGPDLSAYNFLYNGRYRPINTGPFGIVTALNEKDQVTGQFSFTVDGGITGHAAILTSYKATPKDLGTLGGPTSVGAAINNKGWVTGDSDTLNFTGEGMGYYNGEYDVISTAPHAFLYKDNALRDLGTLGGTVSVGLGLNDQGEVIGYSDTTLPNVHHAFYYDGQVLQDLNDLVTDHDFSLLEAVAINEKGVILANGKNAEGQNHALLLTPVDQENRVE